MNIKYLAAIMTITALTAPAYATGTNNTIGGTDNIATANSAAVFGYQNQTHVITLLPLETALTLAAKVLSLSVERIQSTERIAL